MCIYKLQMCHYEHVEQPGKDFYFCAQYLFIGF